jgi:hypothetical protein
MSLVSGIQMSTHNNSMDYHLTDITNTALEKRFTARTKKKYHLLLTALLYCISKYDKFLFKSEASVKRYSLETFITKFSNMWNSRCIFSKSLDNDLKTLLNKQFNLQTVRDTLRVYKELHPILQIKYNDALKKINKCQINLVIYQLSLVLLTHGILNIVRYSGEIAETCSLPSLSHLQAFQLDTGMIYCCFFLRK